MTGFRVDFVSPVEFDHLAAEICYGDQIICRIKCEREDGEIEIDFLHEMREPVRPVSFPLVDFLRLVEEIASEVKSLRQKESKEE